MKQFLLSMILALPLVAHGAGWVYVEIDENGNETRVSPHDLDLSLPSTSADATRKRVMIYYQPSKPSAPKVKSSARQFNPVSWPSLVELTDQ